MEEKINVELEIIRLKGDSLQTVFAEKSFVSGSQKEDPDPE